jgi:penicillin-binding protein 1C
MKRIIPYSILLVLIAGLAWWLFFALDRPIFDNTFSTVVLDRDGHLLNASIADDGQWRFPAPSSIPEKYVAAVVLFEDKNFWYHPGIDITAIARAIQQNIKAGKVVSGGSTISMQLMRMACNSNNRSLKQKLYEGLLALRLELGYSKQEILTLYAANAPFGGNIVGLEAASWRYFGRDPNQLSWAEAALLAVLPNAPSSMHPGKNRDQLRQKRDRLLTRLYTEQYIDSVSLKLSMLEPLPEAPHPLPQKTLHLQSLLSKNGQKGKRFKTTISSELQSELNSIIHKHYEHLSQNDIHNAAALIIDIRNNEVLAYCGNTQSGPIHSSYVDIVQAPRSTGSILKPFLYALSQKEGKLLPNTIVPDIPTQIAGYVPRNFSRTYDGAVSVSEALSRSLNIPAVHMLQDYGYPNFYHKLKKLGINTLNKPADHYGLSLILGGAETTLWDLAASYSTLANTLNNYHEQEGVYFESGPPSILLNERNKNKKTINPEIDAAASWLTFEALTSVNRPEQEAGWQYFNSSRKVAWKTGTSFGFRDAWAVGITPDYLVAVWVGNADGEGRPGLVGVRTAGPVLFDIFNSLPSTAWFEKPYDELRRIPVCQKSGYKVSKHCEAQDSIWVHESGLSTGLCPYHHLLHLDSTATLQVDASCYPLDKMLHKPWFVIPPAWATFFQRRNADYLVPPPKMQGCEPTLSKGFIDLIYPQANAEIFIPIELDGRAGKSVFKAASTNQYARLFWHVDDEMLGTTVGDHTLAVQLPVGEHDLYITDEAGHFIRRKFTIIPDTRYSTL